MNNVQISDEDLAGEANKVSISESVKTAKSYKTLIPVKSDKFNIPTKKLKTSDNYLNFKKAYSNMGYDFSDKEMFDIMKYSYFINRNKGLSSPIISNLFYQNLFIISSKDVLSRKDSNSVRDLINNYLIYEDITAISRDAYLIIAEAIIKQEYNLHGMVNWKDGVQMILEFQNPGDLSSIDQSDDSEETSGAPVGSQGEPITSSNEIDVGSALGNMFASCVQSGGKGGFGGSLQGPQEPGGLPQAPGSSFSPVGTTTTEGPNVKLGETGMDPTFNPTTPPFEDCKLSPLKSKGSAGDPTPATPPETPAPKTPPAKTPPATPPETPAPKTPPAKTPPPETHPLILPTPKPGEPGYDPGEGSETGTNNPIPLPDIEGGSSLSPILTISSNDGVAIVTYHPEGGSHGVSGFGSLSGGVSGGMGYSGQWIPDPSSSSEVGAQVDQCKEMACFFLEAVSPQVEKDIEYYDCISGVLNDALPGSGDISPVILTTGDFSNFCGELDKNMKGPFAEAFTDPSPIQGQVMYTFNPIFEEQN